MILLIKIFISWIMLMSSSLAIEMIYKQDGKYRMVSDIHLINNVSYKDNNFYQVLVEIPTGSRQKWEVTHKGGQLEWEFKDDHPREISFLGYPGNYGFIPQTLSGDGDALDVIVLSESVNRGDVLNVNIIGMIKLIDSGDEDTKILAITAKSPFKNVNTLEDMLIHYPNVVPIIKEWFEGYKGLGRMLFTGYGTAQEAVEHIEESHKKWLKHKF